MKYRLLGRTGLQVSEIGFGGWGIGKTSWIGADDRDSIRALSVARDAGVNFFDTALVYGDGHSERLLAQTFGKSHDLVVATKVPPKNRKWPARRGTSLRDVFPKDHVLQCLDQSLANLQRDVIDLYQFHVWSDEWAREAEWQQTVEEIRRSGKVRFIGISINDHEPENVLLALQSGLVDTVQVIYNVFDQTPQDRLFPFCRQQGIGVIARVPFDEGSLTGTMRPDTTFPAGDFRNYYFGWGRKRRVCKRIRRLVQDVGVNLNDLPELALRFCISNHTVNTVIAGMRTPAHVERNVKASDDGLLAPELLSRLYRHRWSRNFYSPPTSWTRKIKDAILEQVT
jgi:aryl-alcohol dehydrogenase-like predicted oxidoreductase